MQPLYCDAWQHPMRCVSTVQSLQHYRDSRVCSGQMCWLLWLTVLTQCGDYQVPCRDHLNPFGIIHIKPPCVVGKCLHWPKAYFQPPASFLDLCFLAWKRSGSIMLVWYRRRSIAAATFTPHKCSNQDKVHLKRLIRPLGQGRPDFDKFVECTIHRAPPCGMQPLCCDAWRHPMRCESTVQLLQHYSDSRVCSGQMCWRLWLGVTVLTQCGDYQGIASRLGLNPL
jgi:hypothetical protein